MSSTLLQPWIRWLIRRDTQEALAIDAASFADPLSETDLIALLRQRNVIAMVVEYQERVVGYVVYELHKHRLNIIRLAVHPDFRRTSMATIMLEKIKGKLYGTGKHSSERTAVTVSVPDDNLPAHLLLKSAGFVAMGVKRKFRDADVYGFIFDRSWVDVS